MAMHNMWWRFRFLFGQTVFLNCLTECQTSCLGFSICLINIENASRIYKEKFTMLSLTYTIQAILHIFINNSFT